MRLVLRKLGYRPDVVGNGHEVIEAFQRQRYDVVLMDLQMPEMDGLQATRSLRAELAPAEQPRIVAVTADVVKERIQLCLDAGMDRCLTKPLQLPTLIDALVECRELAT